MAKLSTALITTSINQSIKFYCAKVTNKHINIYTSIASISCKLVVKLSGAKYNVNLHRTFQISVINFSDRHIIRKEC